MVVEVVEFHCVSVGGLVEDRKRGSPLPADDYATSYHTPVLVEEVLRWLDVDVDKRFVDATVGGGGHTKAILDASEPNGQVLGIDRDPKAIEEATARLADHGERVVLMESNYGDVDQALRQVGWPPVDGFLVDAGVSSHQFDEADRGFSFQREGPLDMRMGPDAVTVAQFLDDTDVDELARVLREYGEVSRSWPLAKAIVDARRRGQLETTRQLADLVEDRRPRFQRGGRSSIHPATLVFQALRIAVNRELEHLEAAVESIPDVVAGGGRAVFISFHSLEDRIVKHGFRRLAEACICPPDLPRCGCEAVSIGEVLTSSPVTASPDERDANPRARSAKLRAFSVHEDGPSAPASDHDDSSK